MSYSLEFVESALKEWRKLSPDIREPLKKKLAERLASPHVPAARLHGMPDCYKIKLRASGCRLVYQVQDKVLVVTAVAVGRRERGLAYLAAKKRL
jgi:mRNA interferase RelE/StbE